MTFSSSFFKVRRRVSGYKRLCGRLADMAADSELPKTKNLHLQVMDKWGLMGSFFQLPWFNRLWTLQEIVVNSNDALFYYGDQSIEWSTMKSALMLMQERFYDHSSPLNDTIGLYVEMQDDVQRWRSAWFSNPYMCDDCLNFGNLDLPKPQLSDILARARTRKCSDPKDKVFGLFGICQFLQVHMPTPDYGKSVEQIFFEVTKAIVDGEEDLSFLYEISGPIRNPRLPSWVPDWEHGWVHKVGAPLTKAEYYSAGGQKCQESVIIDAEIMMLKVRGKVIDVISQCHKSIPVFDNLPISSIFNAMHMAHMDLMEDLWSSWEAFCEWVQCVRQQFSESGDTMEAFNSTLLQGVDLPVGIESKNVQAAFDRWFLALVKTHEAVEKEEGQENKDKMNRNMCTRSLLDGDVDTPDMRMFHGNACLLSGGRSFFTTASCRMGTCQGEISEGDVVAVVAGLKLPLVLRPIGEHFRLVGHAYVHGIMHGEAWSSDQTELRTIGIV